MIVRKKNIFMQKLDIKSSSWSKAAESQSLGQLIPIAGSPMKMPFVLLWNILIFRKPNGIIFRYLNDYKSPIRSILRLLTDYATVYIGIMTNIKILWICHNVDRESSSHFPTLTRYRRGLLVKKADHIFVLDDLLVYEASKLFNIDENKIIPISFGEIENINGELNSNVKELIQRIQKWKININSKSSEHSLFGLWIGTASEKLYEGLKFIAEVLKSDSFEGIYFVVIGSIGTWLKKRDYDVYKILSENKNVCFIDNHINIPTNKWPYLSDFIWKPSNDLSINLTCYNAASAKLPIVGFNDTFHGRFIDKYKIGVSISPKAELFDSKDFTLKITRWDKENASKFLKDKTWGKSVKIFFDFV